MLDLILSIGLLLPFILAIVFVIYRNGQRRWARSRADRIIEGKQQADVAFINGIIEILRPPHFYSVRSEEDLYRVEQLRRIRDKPYIE